MIGFRQNMDNIRIFSTGTIYNMNYCTNSSFYQVGFGLPYTPPYLLGNSQYTLKIRLRIRNRIDFHPE